MSTSTDISVSYTLGPFHSRNLKNFSTLSILVFKDDNSVFSYVVKYGDSLGSPNRSLRSGVSSTKLFFRSEEYSCQYLPLLKMPFLMSGHVKNY